MSSLLAMIVLATTGGSLPDASWSPRVPPTARFTGPGTVVISWETARSMTARVAFGPEGGKLKIVTGESSGGRKHRVEINGLAGARPYSWQVVGTVKGKRVRTSLETLDPKFNYTVAPVAGGPDPWGDDAARDAAASKAKKIVGFSGARTGYAVVVGVGDGRLLLELARATDLSVVGLDDDRARIDAARRGLYKAGAYGHRVTVRHLERPTSAELPRWFANTVIVHRDSPPMDVTDWKDLWRLVRPDGGMLVVADGHVDIGTVSKVSDLAGVPVLMAPSSDQQVLGWRRPAVDGAGSWTHLYGRLDNQANSGDRLLGVKRAAQMDVQWLGRPGPDAMTDRNPRKPSPLATRGRIFTQGRKRIIAQDQYNGAILWSIEVPDLVRMNMPRDCANWCVDDEGLWVAVRDQVWLLDPATGGRAGVWHVADGKTDAGANWGFIGSLGSGLVIGSAVKPDAQFTNIFGGSGEGWADATKGPVTRKVLSDCLFGLDWKSGERRWTWRRGLIMNPTITVSEDTVYFVETRNSGLLAAPARAVESPDLWTDLWMVALDPESGRKRWERQVKPAPGTVVFYLVYASDTLLMLSSGTRYELYAFDAKDGKDRWHQGHDWPNHHHGRHMQHPVVVNGVVYVRPRGYAVADGALVTDEVPDGGCGTISASADALMFRAGTIRMWDPQTGAMTDWNRLRPGCWLSTITAGGMLLAPEAGGGCSCAGWFETSIGFLRSEHAPPEAGARTGNEKGEGK